MTFTGTSVDLDRLSGCVFGLTAEPEEREVAAGLVADLGGRPMWVPESRRALYHAGLAHGANHLVTLVTEAMELLAAAGADDPAATLRPLLTAALDNALEHGDAALTGPIVRGDVNTVRAHLADIAAQAPDHAAELSRAGARHARPRRHRRPAGADPGAARSTRCSTRRPPRSRPAPRPAHHVTRCPVAVAPHPRRAGRAPAQPAARAGERVGFVPTMGALHDGHASLMRVARERVGGGPRRGLDLREPAAVRAGEDLDRYPRTLDVDLEVCEREGVDVVFVPSVDEVYPGGSPPSDPRP